MATPTAMVLSMAMGRGSGSGNEIRSSTHRLSQHWCGRGNDGLAACSRQQQKRWHVGCACVDCRESSVKPYWTFWLIFLRHLCVRVSILIAPSNTTLMNTLSASRASSSPVGTLPIQKAMGYSAAVQKMVDQ